MISVQLHLACWTEQPQYKFGGWEENVDKLVANLVQKAWNRLRIGSLSFDNLQEVGGKSCCQHMRAFHYICIKYSPPRQG